MSVRQDGADVSVPRAAAGVRADILRPGHGPSPAPPSERPTQMSRRGRLAYLVRWAGPRWLALYVVRQAMSRALFRIHRWMMRIEERRFLTGEMTVSGQFNTARQNATMWNQYNWQRLGEEWTDQAQVQRGFDAEEWKGRVIRELLERYMPRDGTLLEVGPGGGRWTASLLSRSRALILVDVAEKCLNVCRDRFQADARLRYHLVDPTQPEFISAAAVPDDSVDGIWSYDVFVHINPTDIATYLRDFRRILRAGSVAVIHHTGRTPSDWDYNEAFRSQMNAKFFAHLAREAGLQVLDQSEALVHKPGDVITVLQKPLGPGSPAATPASIA
jgi:ubiquinone/menaquinone biosynthesis C-methylase UbiE